LQATLKQHEQRLASMDKCWKVPYAWLQACMGEGGQEYLTKAFLKCLPSKSEHITPAASVQAIQQLTSPKLFSFSSRGGQGAVNAAREMVNCLVHGFAPSLGKNPSSFLTQVWAKLPNFCKYKHMGNSLVGQAACEAMLEDIACITSHPCKLYLFKSSAK
jgi:hypothetical protein